MVGWFYGMPLLSAKWSRPLGGWENALRKISVEKFKANQKSPQTTETKDDVEARRDSWSIQGEFVCRDHNQPRGKLYAPKEGTFPNSTEIHWRSQVHSQRFGCDAGETHRWLLEHRREQKFVRFLERIPKHHSIERKTYKRDARGPVWRPDNVCPEVWTKIGKAAQKREKSRMGKREDITQFCSTKRGIYFIDQEDEEYKESIKNARRYLEVQMDAAMPCKKKTKSLTSSPPGQPERGVMHLTRFQKRSMLEKWKLMNPQGNGTTNGRSSRRFQHGSWKKSREKGRLFWRHRKTKGKSTLLHWWTCVISKNAELEPKIQKYRGPVVLRGDIVNDDSGLYWTGQDYLIVMDK